MTQADTLAPWAEVVPNAGPMTVDALLELPDDGWQYELVEGRLVRMPPGGGGASIVAARLLIRLGAYVEDHGLGELTDAQGGYDFSALGQPYTVLAPDVAFVRSDRLPDRESTVYTKAWPLAPDLVAEVASPTQYRPGLTAKAQRYLAAGVRLVWIIWPQRGRVDVWRPGDIRPSNTLEITGMLDGLEVVPGFTFPVAALFR